MITRDYTLDQYRPAKHMLDLLRCIEGLGFIAGGFARYMTGFWPDLVPSDIDVFAYSKEGSGDAALFKALTRKYEQLPNPVPTTTSFKIAQFEIPIQFVHARSNEYNMTYGTPEEVLSEFDFTTNQFALELIPGQEMMRFTIGNQA